MRWLLPTAVLFLLRAQHLAAFSYSPLKSATRRGWLASTIGIGAILLHQPSAVAAEKKIPTDCTPEAIELARLKLETLEPLTATNPAQFEAELGGVSPKIGKLLANCAGNHHKKKALADSFLEHTRKAIKRSKRPDPDPVAALSELMEAEENVYTFLKHHDLPTSGQSLLPQGDEAPKSEARSEAAKAKAEAPKRK